MAQPPIRYAEAATVLEDAIAAIRAIHASHGVERESLPLSASSGRILAEAMLADRDQPPFPRSTRDGFACRAGEANSHQFLRLAACLRAGQDPATIASGGVEPGQVWEIMTGAPAPAGADAVFMVEHAEYSSDSAPVSIHNEVYAGATRWVRLGAAREVGVGENIVAAGSEARAGELLVAPGTRLGPAHIALAAQCGRARLAVFARPAVAILSTGDELVAVEATPGPSQIRNSNAPMLAALVSAAGGEAVILPAAADSPAALDTAIGEALDCRMLLISGGISAGRFDLVEDALTRAGASWLFRGVAMQPGKPVAFGQIPRAKLPPLAFFALPGNPISSAATFHLFAAPLLAALAGDSGSYPRFALAELASPWRGKAGLTRLLPARCDFGLAPKVAIVPWHGSGDLAAFARANCFAVIPDEAEAVDAGAAIPILRTD